MSHPAVFLDRDGVLLHDDGYVFRPEQARWIDGVFDALRSIKSAGYLTLVVTNQSGVARGYFTERDVQAFHTWMSDELATRDAHIDDFAYCPYLEDGAIADYAKASTHRKPGPGMIFDLAQKWSVDMTRSFLVGDKQTDLDAAEAAGIPGYLFESGSLLDFVQSKLPAAI